MTAPASLHQSILRDLETQIQGGVWPPGSQIPFEQDLARQYGCSRMTVNKVMTQLVSAGLIERRRKAGSFVKQPQSQSAVLDIVDIRREVEQLGLSYGFEMIDTSHRTSRKCDQHRLGLPTPAPVLDLSCRHLAGRAPFCLEERLINLSAVPAARHQDFATIAPGAWLMAHVPWTSAEHKIRAVGADAATATALAIPLDTPCLQVDRRTWAAGVPITFVRFTYPGHRQELVARFTQFS